MLKTHGISSTNISLLIVFPHYWTNNFPKHEISLLGGPAIMLSKSWKPWIPLASGLKSRKYGFGRFGGPGKWSWTVRKDLVDGLISTTNVFLERVLCLLSSCWGATGCKKHMTFHQKNTSTKSKIDEIKNDKTCQNRRGALAICHLFIKQSNDWSIMLIILAFIGAAGENFSV